MLNQSHEMPSDPLSAVVSSEPKTMVEVREINSAFPYTAPIREWKEQARKVIALQCAYVPEEIIWAAGALPVRMTGDVRQMELEDANSYLYINTCAFCRTCLQLALDGRWDFLDGYVSSATCDGARRLADIWQSYLEIPLIKVLGVPRKTTERACQLYMSELGDMKELLEQHLGVSINDQALWDAIRLYNRTRGLLRELYELRKADPPPVWGFEVMEVLNAGLRMPKDKYNVLLERLLDEIRSSERQVSGRVRLMVSGSPLNNPNFFRAFEQVGGVAVIDDLCVGTQFWWEPVDTAIADPLEALARHYLNSFTCARMASSDTRFNQLLKLVEEWRVDGMVSQVMPYCVVYAHDQPLLAKKLEAIDVPMLELEVEYGAGSTGQITTRAQAFIEMIAAKKEGV